MGALDRLKAATKTKTGDAVKTTDTSDVGYKEISLALIDRDASQPRTELPNYDLGQSDTDNIALMELAGSIKASGVLEPIRVRKNGDRFMIIAGERRWRAARIADLAVIPAIVEAAVDENNLEDKRRIRVEQIAENLLREDLTELELANALLRLKSEEQMLQSEIATALGLTDTKVSVLIKAAQPVNALDVAICGGSPEVFTKFDGLPETTKAELRAQYEQTGTTVSGTQIGKIKAGQKSASPAPQTTAASAPATVAPGSLSTAAEPNYNDDDGTIPAALAGASLSGDAVDTSRLGNVAAMAAKAGVSTTPPAAIHKIQLSLTLTEDRVIEIIEMLGGDTNTGNPEQELKRLLTGSVYA